MLMTRRRCILVGEAPNASGVKDLLHLKLAARARDEVKTFGLLRQGYLIRLREQDPTLWEWARSTSHVNLLNVYPGEKFPIERGREAAEKLWAILVDGAPRGAVVMFAGSSVAQSFGYFRDPWLPALIDGIKIMRVPHPSGLCRTWNDPEQRRLALGKLRNLGDSFAKASQASQDAPESEGARVFELRPER